LPNACKTQVHEIGYAECPKSYVFRGSKDYTSKQVQEMLGLMPQAMRPGVPIQPGRAPAPVMGATARFLLPVQQAEFQLTNALEQLQKDPWPVANDKRALRCTGVALSVAIGLMEASFQNSGGRIMLFAAGPATEGPGMVVGPDLRDTMRSHHDIDRDNIKYYKKAHKVRLRRLCSDADVLVLRKPRQASCPQRSHCRHICRVPGPSRSSRDEKSLQ
jgi:protein transport protein SEC23